jgi:hypothetical protein
MTSLPPSPVSEFGVKAEITERRLRVEVEERLRATEGEAGPLDEGAVCVELVRRVVATFVLVLRPTAM